MRALRSEKPLSLARNRYSNLNSLFHLTWREPVTVPFKASSVD